jgi:hypothetical protein
LHVGLLDTGLTRQGQVHTGEDPGCLPGLQGLSIDVIEFLSSAPKEQVGWCT